MRHLAAIILCLAAVQAAGQTPAAGPDDRDAHMADRYIEVLKSRPVEGDVLGSLAALYDRTGHLDDLSARLDAIAREDAKAEWPCLVRGHVERWRGRPDAARAAYAEALARNPESYLARAGLARALDDLGRSKEAESAWKDALTRVDVAVQSGLDVKDETSAILRALGRLAVSAGRADDARAWWAKLVALDPEDLSRREELARILVENRFFDDAVKTLEDMMARSAGDGDRRTRAAREIGRALDAAGRTDEALAAYARAVDLTARGNWMRRQIRADVFDLCERAGRLTGLEKSLAARAAKNPDDAETWEDLLRVRERLSDREGTAKACENLLRLRPDDSSLRRRRASELADAGAWKESAALWREVARREPKDVKARLELARAIKGSGDVEGAAASLDAASADFSDAAPLAEIARALEQSGASERAEKAYRRALAAAPDDVAACSELAGFLRRAGRKGEAALTLVDFAAKHARSVEASSAAGRLLRDWGETDEALAALRRAAELAPADGARWKDFAQAALDAERFDEAIAGWEEAARFAPSDRSREEAWDQVITILQSRDKLEDQLAAWREIAKVLPDDEQAARRLGLALERLGRMDPPDGAAAVYEEFLNRRPAARTISSALARIEALGGHAAKAAELYERRIDLDPADARECLVELVQLYLEDEKPDLARDAAKRLVEKFPFDPSAHAELARAEESTGHNAEAAAAWSRALELKPDDRAMLEALARTLESAGESGRLVELRRRVLRSNPGRDACLDSVRALIRLADDGRADDLAGIERLLAARLSQDRRNFTWYLALGEVLRAEERPEKIESLYREALDAVAPASRSEAIEALARLAAEVGDAPAAVRWTEELRREQGLPRETLPQLAAFYYAAGRPAEARRALDEWLRADDKNPEARRFVADVARRHDDLEGALDAFLKLIALGPARPGAEGETDLHVARIEAADLSAQLDRIDDATKLLIDVLDKLPGADADGRANLPPMPGGVTRDTPADELRAKAVETLARIHLDAHRLDALIDRLETRVNADPTRESYHDDLARTLAAAGETGRRVKALERARQAFPNSFNVARELARAYEALDDRAEDALRELDAAAKLAADREPSLQDERIELMLKLGRTDDVKSFARRLIDEMHDAPRAVEAADRCSTLGEFDLAAWIFDEATAKAPGAANAWLAGARAFRAAERPDEAARLIRGYLAATRPKAEESVAPALLAADRLRRIDDAIRVLGPAACDRLLEDLRAEGAKAPKSAALMADVASLELRLGKRVEFARTCRRLMALMPDDALAARAVEDMRLRGWNADARAFVLGVIDDPACRSVRSRVALATVERMSDLVPDEVLTLRLAATLDTATPEEGVSRRADRTLAEFYWSRGRRDEAIRRLRAVVEKRPDDADATLELAGWLYATGAADEAKSMAARAAAIVALPTPTTAIDAGRSVFDERRAQIDGLLESFDRRGLSGAIRERLAKSFADAPDDAIAGYDLAAADARAGRLDAALDTLKKMLDRAPGDVSARLAVAQTLQNLGRHAEAIAEFERAASVRPPQRELFDRWIEAKVRSGDRAGALALRERAAALFAEPRLLEDVARDWRGIGLEDRALAAFRRYLRLQYGPSALLGANAAAAREYAAFLRQSGRCEPAARVLERALAVARIDGLDDADSDALRFELAATWRAMGRLDELIRRIAARVAAEPADAADADFLAALYATRGDDARAIEVRRGLAQSRPHDADNLQQLAEALRRSRRLDEAVEVQRRLLDVDPANAYAALTAVAEMKFEKGDTPGAVATAKMLLLDRYSPRASPAERLQSAAFLYGRMGLADLELDALRRAVARTRGGSVQARAALVKALSARGDPDTAAEEADRALESAGDDIRRSLIIEALLSVKSLDALLAAAERLERSEAVSNDAEMTERVESVLHDRIARMGRPDLAADVAARMCRASRGLEKAPQAARELTQLGRCAEALALLSARLRESPEDASARLEQARALLAAGRVKEGARAVDDYLRRRPLGADRIEAAQALADAGLWESALARLDLAGGEAASSMEFGELRAEALERSGRTNRAAEAWGDLMARFPSERAFLGAGRFFLSAGRLDRAEAVLRELMRLDPGSLDGARMLGETLRRAGKPDAAVETWSQAREGLDAEGIRREFTDRVERTLRESKGATPASRAEEAARSLDAVDAEWAAKASAFAEALEAAGRRDEALDVRRKLASLARNATMRQHAAERLKPEPGPDAR